VLAGSTVSKRDDFEDYDVTSMTS